MDNVTIMPRWKSLAEGQGDGDLLSLEFWLKVGVMGMTHLLLNR